MKKHDLRPHAPTRPVLHEGPTCGIPPRPADPSTSKHRRGWAAMLSAAGLVPLWLILVAMLQLAEGFCSDGNSVEECARQAAGTNRFMVVSGLGIVGLFVVGAVRYARHAPTQPPRAHTQDRAWSRQDATDAERTTSGTGAGRRALVAELLGVVAAMSALAVFVTEQWLLLPMLIAPLAAFPGALAGLLAMVELHHTRSTSTDRHRALVGTLLSLATIAVIVLQVVTVD